MTVDRALVVVADEKGRTFGDLVLAAEVLAQAVLDLRGDLRMVRSGRDTFHRLLDERESEIANRKRGHPKRRAERRGTEP